MLGDTRYGRAAIGRPIYGVFTRNSKLLCDPCVGDGCHFTGGDGMTNCRHCALTGLAAIPFSEVDNE